MKKFLQDFTKEISKEERKILKEVQVKLPKTYLETFEEIPGGSLEKISREISENFQNSNSNQRTIFGKNLEIFPEDELRTNFYSKNLEGVSVESIRGTPKEIRGDSVKELSRETLELISGLALIELPHKFR